MVTSGMVTFVDSMPKGIGITFPHNLNPFTQTPTWVYPEHDCHTQGAINQHAKTLQGAASPL